MVTFVQGEHYKTLTTAHDKFCDAVSMVTGEPTPPIDLTLDQKLWSTQTVVWLNTLSPPRRKFIIDLSKGYGTKVMDAFSQYVLPRLLKQEIPEGIISSPQRYFMQEKSNTCQLAIMRMILFETMGIVYSEEDIFMHAIQKGTVRGDPFTGNVAEMVTLETFLENNPKAPDISVIAFKGCDFEDIKGFTAYLKEENPDCKIFVSVSILSELTNISYHTLLLLSINNDHVIVHDPSITRGSAFRKMSKGYFIERYSKAELSGKFIICKKNISTEK